MSKTQMPRPPDGNKPDRPRVAYHGFSKDGVECAVLDDGRRGFILRGLRAAIGMTRNIPVPAFERFCAETSVKALQTFTKSGSRFEVVMPHGGTAMWVEAGILTQVAGGVVRSALTGKLRANRKHMVEPCMAIMDALAETGEVALIDEATGYQHHRAPDALQDLFSKLIRKTASDWEKRFHPDYYKALCKLFGFQYGDRHRPLPSIIGKITQDQVYLSVFPPEIISEVKSRQGREKAHQWLTKDGGLKLLEKQRDAVMMIARSSTDYRDFEARCSVAFYRPGQQVGMVYPRTGGVP
jgi:hypothetical protein